MVIDYAIRDENPTNITLGTVYVSENFRCVSTRMQEDLKSMLQLHFLSLILVLAAHAPRH